ncbi:MAG: hypothetical protein EOP56_10440 [Sphingobacteriales bacterium]|nr:MAG: hypothetical protein EOP56_10440 [Sphingobacteriales bacterium]
MRTFRVSIIGNEVVSCVEDFSLKAYTDVFVQNDKAGNPVFAVIRTASLLNAVQMAEELLEKGKSD